MTPEIKPLIAGNWKMNGFRNSLKELQAMGEGYDAAMRHRLDMLVCVPATLLYTAAVSVVGTHVEIGAQDCHMNAVGAHTGDVSAMMVADCGGTAVIVGHSERRADHNESNETVKSKAEAGLRNDLMTILCIGETEEQRKSGKTLEVLEDQLSNSLPDSINTDLLVIAYEPVWAIGTGMVPSVGDVTEAHEFIRNHLHDHFEDAGKTIRLLYGGSVKPSNAAELMAINNVDGALVGGASLKADDFLGICAALSELDD
ncbi:MAG: triose-phosphate isomerase [Rhizobiaceae bacterium]|nr:triose-phosphate isomerase [Rhizobiaceae bacterium]